jgi:hypothetical protein
VIKTEHRHVVLVALVTGAFGLAGLASFGCSGHSPRRTDWRHPPQACASDADCHGGTCAIEMGASQGTCAGGSLPALPPAPGADGGTRPPGPGPSIQPSSTDIQI